MYMKAAARNCPEAQHNLGVRFEEGRGVEKDERKAIKYYTLASENGDAQVYTNVFCDCIHV
jgi:TPR repeat protein